MTSFECPECQETCYNINAEDEDLNTIDGVDFVCEECDCEFTICRRSGQPLEVYVTKHGFKLGGK